MASNEPGPGSYFAGERFGREGSKFSIAGRPKNEINESRNVPGPAAYDITPIRERRGYKFGTAGSSIVSNSVNLGRSGEPGPGQYDINTRYKLNKRSSPAWRHIFFINY